MSNTPDVIVWAAARPARVSSTRTTRRSASSLRRRTRPLRSRPLTMSVTELTASPRNSANSPIFRGSLEARNSSARNSWTLRVVARFPSAVRFKSRNRTRLASWRRRNSAALRSRDYITVSELFGLRAIVSETSSASRPHLEPRPAGPSPLCLALWERERTGHYHRMYVSFFWQSQAPVIALSNRGTAKGTNVSAPTQTSRACLGMRAVCLCRRIFDAKLKLHRPKIASPLGLRAVEGLSGRRQRKIFSEFWKKRVRFLKKPQLGR